MSACVLRNEKKNAVVVRVTTKTVLLDFPLVGGVGQNNL